MSTSNREIGHGDSRSFADGEQRAGDDEEGGKTTSLLIVVLSLVFVAIFGGALIGGIVSGDPTNAFFITTIVASVFAISVALGVSIRYFVTRPGTDGADGDYQKDDVRGTFSSSDEENYYDEDYGKRSPDYEAQNYRYPSKNPIAPQIKEIEATSICGDMSALSPTTYDEGSLSTFRHHIIQNGRRGFDFSSITSTKNGENVNSTRADPPEGTGTESIQAAWNARGSSLDPSAPKFSTEGDIIVDDGGDDGYNHGRESNENDSEVNYSVRDDKSIFSSKSRRSRRSFRSRSRSRSKSKSPSAARSRSSKSKSPSAARSRRTPANSETNSMPFSEKQEETDTIDLRRPASTKSGRANSVKSSSVPTTPAASEAGSLASSFFKPLNGMIGKAKKAFSEVGVSDLGISSGTKQESQTAKEKVTAGISKANKPPMVRPPMIPSSKKVGEGLQTIGGRVGPTSTTPSNNSTFTIPPPRPIPRTPMGSEVFSEFQSVAGSTYSNGAASSTFDPLARERAIEKMRKNQASIGASPAMPIYYNDDDDDDDDDDKNSPVAEHSPTQSNAISYDVFAPPGALGIVVDTTEKGCVVYSLKKSSPMQGLMNRGDLIIGLDNFDVRNMNAASLTKLMAKKSKQAERKFTLIPID
eukprot:jgi/Psemu1/294456/fgenesh1_pm.19_\